MPHSDGKTEKPSTTLPGTVQKIIKTPTQKHRSRLKSSYRMQRSCIEKSALKILW
jgi:hypothetical protein